MSPKTGRAASREAARPWQDQLLRLPAFLLQQPHGLTMPDQHALADGFALTGHFLHRHVYEPRGQEEPDTRRAFLAAIMKELGAETDKRSAVN